MKTSYFVLVLATQLVTGNHFSAPEDITKSPAYLAGRLSITNDAYPWLNCVADGNHQGIADRLIKDFCYDGQKKAEAVLKYIRNMYPMRASAFWVNLMDALYKSFFVTETQERRQIERQTEFRDLLALCLGVGRGVEFYLNKYENVVSKNEYDDLQSYLYWSKSLSFNKDDPTLLYKTQPSAIDKIIENVQCAENLYARLRGLLYDYLLLETSREFFGTKIHKKGDLSYANLAGIEPLNIPVYNPKLNVISPNGTQILSDINKSIILSTLVTTNFLLYTAHNKQFKSSALYQEIKAITNHDDNILL